MSSYGREKHTETTHLLISSENPTIGAPSLQENREAEVIRKVSRFRRWVSIFVLYFTMMTVTLTFSVVIPSLYQYTTVLTHSASTTTVGWVIAAYSMGQLVSSPLFGVWSDRRPTMEPIVCSLLLNVVSNIAYSYSEAFDYGGQYMVMAARILVGMSAGSAAVVRSYVVAATTEKERIAALTGVSASQSIGFTIGPFLAMAFVSLGGKGLYVPAIRFKIDMYTGPGYLSALLAIINIIAMLVLFREHRINVVKPKVVKDSKKMSKLSGTLTISQSNDLPSIIVKPKYRVDKIASFVAIILFFVMLFVFSVFETIIVPYTMDEFAWDRQKADLWNSVIFGALSVISIITFVSIVYINRVVQERVLMMVGLFAMAISYFVIIPMSDTKPTIGEAVILTNSGNTTIPPGVGCRFTELAWCQYLPQLTLIQYIISLGILSMGFNTSVVACFTIYSKILGPFPQGIMMGIITAVGSLSRALGPLSVTFLYDKLGPQITFAIIVGMISLAIILLMTCCYRMVPYGKKHTM